LVFPREESRNSDLLEGVRAEWSAGIQNQKGNRSSPAGDELGGKGAFSVVYLIRVATCAPHSLGHRIGSSTNRDLIQEVKTAWKIKSFCQIDTRK
jgi:hypothetical protein